MNIYNIENLITEILLKIEKAKEIALVKRIEELLDRVPSNEEVAKFGYKNIHSDKEVFLWKGKPILEFKVVFHKTTIELLIKEL